jgi:hypothetical protein
MNECPDTDTVVTIGNSLNWKVADGMRHLQTCDECRTQIKILETMHSAFTEIEEVDETVYNRIDKYLHSEARNERKWIRMTQRRVNKLETVMAGITALVVLASSGITPGSILIWVTGFFLGAAMVAVGKILFRGISDVHQV